VRVQKARLALPVLPVLLVLPVVLALLVLPVSVVLPVVLALLVQLVLH
jgi:hypothetical protein